MTRSQLTIRRSPRWAAMALLLGAILHPESLPADAASRPAAAPAPTSQPASAAVPTSLQDELAFVTDYDNVVYDAGYYALVEALPNFRPEDAKEVTVAQLLKSPELFRGRPVRMTLTFFDVVEPDRDTDSKARSFEIRAYAGDIRRTKPVTIFSPIAPPKMRSGAKVEVLGYFYKVIKRRHEGAARNDDSPMLEVPVIVAYQFNPLSAGSEQVGWKFNPVFLWIPVVVGLGIAYIWLRSRYSRTGSAWQQDGHGAASRSYRPLRHDMTPEENERIKANLEDLTNAAQPDHAPPDLPADKAPPGAGK